MVPEHLSRDRTVDGPSDPTQAIPTLKSGDKIPSTPDNATRECTIPADLIITQPVPAARPFSEPSDGPLYKACPRCGGLPSPGTQEPRPHPLSPAPGGLQASRVSLQTTGGSKRSKSRESLAHARRPSATQEAMIPKDSCLHLLLACLSCQCTLMLLGVLEACSPCLHGPCSRCCGGGDGGGCAGCCTGLRGAPVGELHCGAHCHSVLFESCCEPTETLEFCLECCALCHRG